MKEAILGYEELQCDIVLLVVGYFFCLIAHWCRGVKTQPHKVIHLTALCIHYSTQCTAIHLTLIAPQLFKSSFLCSAHADHCRLSSRLRGKRARPRFFSAEDSRYEMFTYWPWELIHVSADKNVLRIPCVHCQCPAGFILMSCPLLHIAGTSPGAKTKSPSSSDRNSPVSFLIARSLYWL